jgi:hypothetical protein
MTSVLKNPDLLLEGKDSIDVNALNQESGAGKKLYDAASQILRNLGKEGTVISLADASDKAAIKPQPGKPAPVKIVPVKK